MAENYDSIGAVRLLQSRRGVKASVDGLLLARFLTPLPGWRVADLGCGNGLVGLLAASAQPLCRVTGIEIQGVLVSQAERSARLNNLTNIHFLRADLRHPPWREDAGCFDLVTANPPYRKAGTGRISPDPVRAGARHELFGDIGDFSRAAASLLGEGGRASWVYLAEREEDLRRAVVTAGLFPVRIRRVMSRQGESPSLVLLETVRGRVPGPILEEAPLVLYSPGKGRNYTGKARQIIYGKNVKD